MKYIFISIALVIIIVFLLIYPFKITTSNHSNYLYVNISNFVTLKINLLLLLEKVRNNGISNQKKGIQILKKLRFKSIDLDVKGLCFDYQVSGTYYGIICAISGLGKKYLETQNVEYNYNFEYLGEKSIEFQSVIRARALAIIRAINSI